MVFAGIAAFALLTKYVIKYKGTHVFNPSNIGLVVAFIVLGETRIEPLDFWWAPLTNPAMILAYVVIIGGGLLITRRLRLLAMAATFWVTLAVGVGILAASGHSMVANWAFAPVSGVDFWRVIVTSPEVMIFLFFMITDPKTTPGGRVGRVTFGFLVAVMSTLLMAPQTDEFGTKVGLLAGLVVVCAARPILDRLLPAPRSESDEIGLFARRVALGGNAGLVRGIAGVGLTLGLVLVLGVGIVAAGTPARGAVAVNYDEILNRVPHQVDPSTFPAITVGQDVTDFDHTLVGTGAQEVVQTMAENLGLESQALLRRDGAILTAVDHGDRLDEMQGRLADAIASGTTTVDRYDFDTVDMSLLKPFGKQTGLSIGMASKGTMTEETYDAAGKLLASRRGPVRQGVRRPPGDGRALAQCRGAAPGRELSRTGSDPASPIRRPAGSMPSRCPGYGP